MSAGRWMTIEDAFARLVELEGVAAVAFPAFCQMLHNQPIHAIKKDMGDTFVYPEDEDERAIRFMVTHEIWNILDVELENSELKIGYELFHKQNDVVFINGKDFDPFILNEWQFIIKTVDVERVAADCADTAPKTNPPSKGGAPTKYDWSAAGAAAAAFVVDNDYPEDRSELERHVRAWFRERGSEPDKRDIRQFIGTMYQEKQRLEGLRKTRFPELSAPQR